MRATGEPDPMSTRTQLFKNLTLYRIAAGWSADAAQVERALQQARFVECGSTQPKSVGWSEPRGEKHGPLLEAVAGQWILKLTIETKAVPGSVIRRKAQERADQIEATTGRKPGKKETRDLKEDALLQLLPMAFAKQSSVTVWIDREAGLLMTDAGSQSKTDDVITELVKALDGLSISLLQTQTAPSAAMALWLTSREAPGALHVDRECELKSTDDTQAVVRYSRHMLDIDEVRQHIAGGKVPTRLALSWDGRVSFVLTETLQLKKIKFLDGVFEAGETGAEEGFDTDVAIATGELRKLLPDLIEGLGGEMALA